MPQIYPVYYAPDIDNSWAVAPGALTDINGLAPLQDGPYGSVGFANLFGATTLTGIALKGKLYRQVDGSVRLLAFTKTDIDEYDSNGTRTNRGTGYNAGTTNWESAAWGNQIIAVNYLDAPQSSTGAGFSALSGSPPKARYIASNIDFVMMADVNDGGSNNYSDMVWWCGIRNPGQWAPSLQYQSGNVRLLASPGPIRKLVAFRGGFIAFKDNAIFLGQYVGTGPGQYIFRWDLISNKVGLSASDSVVECDNKLYFLHTTGVYEFDGQSLNNISRPIHRTLLSDSSLFSTNRRPAITGVSANALSTIQAVSDDVEGIVWFQLGVISTLSIRPGGTYLYGYNVRSQKWARLSFSTDLGSNGLTPVLVTGSSADRAAFKADAYGRFWMFHNNAAGSPTIQSYRYPYSNTIQPTYTTGVVGSNDGSTLSRKHYWRTLYGTDTDNSLSLSVLGYTTENRNTTNGTASGAVNTELDEGDFTLSARYKTATVTWSASKNVVLAGIGFDVQGGGRR